MGKDRFEFARIASPEEVAEYLASLAVGLKRGEATLESGERVLRLTPASDVKLDLRVQQKEHKGKLRVEIGWKRQTTARLSDLRVPARPRSDRD
jgi:amphi-Trp domain-containing protein